MVGVRSGLVDDNRAWALAGLGRRTECWSAPFGHELLDHPDESRRTQSLRGFCGCSTGAVPRAERAVD